MKTLIIILTMAALGTASALANPTPPEAVAKLISDKSFAAADIQSLFTAVP